MPRQSLLTVSERESLLALPDNREDLIRYYTLNEHDLSVINLHRGKANRLGFTIQLCYMRYPGIILGFGEEPFRPLLDMVARQLGIETDHWKDYGQREQTRREHLDKDNILSWRKSIQLPKPSIGGSPVLGGIKLNEAEERIYVTLSRSNSLAVINLSDTSITEIPSGIAPYAAIQRLKIDLLNVVIFSKN